MNKKVVKRYKKQDEKRGTNIKKSVPVRKRTTGWKTIKGTYNAGL